MSPGRTGTSADPSEGGRGDTGLDPHGPGFAEHRDALFDELRRERPVSWSSAHGGFWMATRYADVRRVLEDSATFSSAFPGRVAVPPTDSGRAPLAPIEVDPPRHTAQISLLAAWFSRSAVAWLHEPVAEQARHLVASAGDRIEVVTQLARPVVSTAITRHLRLPQADAALWVGWAEKVFATRVADPAAAARAGTELRSYVAGLLAERRAEPRDDPWTLLATASVEGAPMPDEEAVGYGVMLLLAGRDATVDGLTTALVHLAGHPEQQARLRAEPDRLPRAVEELLRVHSPIGHLARVATCPVRLGGVEIAAGDTVAVGYGPANRDEAVFPDAATVQLDRRHNAHLAFGAGVHRCLGAALARLVLTAGLEGALAGPALRLDPREPLVAKPNGDTRGYLAAWLLLG